MNLHFTFSIGLLFFMLNLSCQTKIKEATIHIDTEKGHVLQEGASGFNVRIADKVWSYNHPDFREAVHRLKPGWLRYFSGTMGSAFNCATGQYDYNYTMMMDHQQQYVTGHKFTEIKGPHLISDLYELLGEVGGKLVVTINAFTETPEITAELVRFCKNNDISVEVWQFCNEPYFYVPHRDRFFWNDGYDYARKMKPHADEILKVFPDAKLALNFTWDGIWGFMKEINQYQEEEGRYWNVFSKHSYAPHVGGYEPFDKAMRRANTKVIEATSPEAMKEIEDYSWKGAPLLITEFGVWNRSLNGIFSAIYNAEYTLRQLSHPNAFLIGSHEISNKFKPAKNWDDTVLWAFDMGKEIDTRALRTGIEKDDEGKALEILHMATNNSNFTWETYVSGGALVPGLKDAREEAVFARAFKGTDGYDYLALTNRSGEKHKLTIDFGGKILDEQAERYYMYSNIPENNNIPTYKDVVNTRGVELPSYSVMLLRWKSHNEIPPSQTRIYKTRIHSGGITFDWWKRQNASHYMVEYGYTPDCNLAKVKVPGWENNSFTIEQPGTDRPIFFRVFAENSIGAGKPSAVIKKEFSAPGKPDLFRLIRHENTLTAFWKSVPNADGYRLTLKNKKTGVETLVDARNAFGFRQENLEYDVPYAVWVTAYNGLGDGEPSEIWEQTCVKGLPVPPRNISATQQEDGRILLNWVNQDTENSDITFMVLRGNQLHKFDTIATDVKETQFLDNPADKKELYFYTVAAATKSGKTSYYPNIATTLMRENTVSVDVEKIEKRNDAFAVTVGFKNIPLDGDIKYGITFSDISYLNVEEERLESDLVEDKRFVVLIPFDMLTRGREYAIKAFVETNGAPLFSQPPYKTFKY